MLYAYADETQFGEGNDRKAGYGILLSQMPIDATLINEALGLLRRKKNPSKRDRRTLGRGFFHATDDDSFARQCLAAVARRRLAGCFVCSHLPAPLGGKVKTSTIQQSARDFAIVHALNHRGPIDLTVEGAPGLSAKSMNQWRDELYRLMERSVVLTGAPMRFPAISVQVGSKATPGLQFADYFTWATGASIHIHGDVGPRKLGPLLRKYAFKIEQTGQVNAVYDLVSDGLEFRDITHPHLPDLSTPATFSASYDGVDKIAKCLRAIAKNDRLWAPHSAHLKRGLDLASHDWLNFPEKSHAMRVHRLASMFLRAFDTLPLYAGIPRRDKSTLAKLFDLRELARRILDNSSLSSVTLIDAICKARRQAARTSRTASPRSSIP